MRGKGEGETESQMGDEWHEEQEDEEQVVVEKRERGKVT